MMDVSSLALQRSRYPDMSDTDFRMMLQHLDGRQRTLHKLPAFAAIADWWYPVRLSVEQCSSERTARFKAQLMQQLGISGTMVDLTAGYGVDDFFMSEVFDCVHAVEQNEELCRIVAHNLKLVSKPIELHCTTAQSFLSQLTHADLIYVDPARRDIHGGKVFRLEDSSPHVLTLLPTLYAKASRILLKLSPMLDITLAMKQLDNNWDAYVVAVDGEVKEVLMLSHGFGQIHAVDLISRDLTAIKQLSFTKEEELSCPMVPSATGAVNYLLEPSAALLKAGAFRMVAHRYGVAPLGPDTHLYAASQPIADWQGRQWQVLQQGFRSTAELLPPFHQLKRAHVVTRHYPLTSEQLAKKLKLSEGGDTFIIGTRIGNRPTLFLAKG